MPFSKTRLFTTLLFLFLITSVFAEIGIKSFRKLEDDLDARVNAPMNDFNGDLSAIIKVVTTQTGFTFDCGQAGIVKTVNKPSEIWVYIPYGTKKISIFHPQLGQLREWLFTQPIEKATVYELVLTTGKVVIRVEDEQIPTEWVVITSEPTGADVYIDDKATGKQTPFTGQYPMGNHSYRLSLDGYHPDAGKFELVSDAGKKKIISSLKPAFGQLQLSSSPENGATIVLDGNSNTQITPCTINNIKSGMHTLLVSKTLFHDSTQEVVIKDGQTTTTTVLLKPAYGSITLSSKPESGAAVTIDEVSTGKVTPCTIDKVHSGSHTVSLRREWYEPIKKQLIIADGENTTLEMPMNALFGNIDITTIPKADIYIDNTKIAFGTYSGRLNEGIYNIEARKPQHSTDIQKVQIAVGIAKTITLSPKAQLGTLEIESSPIDATITLNGINKGTTPVTFRNLLVGSYTLVLSMLNYVSVTKTIMITESQTTKVNETLSIGKAVNDISQPQLEKVYFKQQPQIRDIDGNLYHTIQIGTQTWMVENLKVTHYLNGDQIPNKIENSEWSNSSNGGMCVYANEPSNSTVYGELYNWYAVSDNRSIAPKGWHIPSAIEWAILTNYLGGENVAGGKLKTADSGGTNQSGFTAFLGWNRDNHGSFENIGDFGNWWSSTESNFNSAVVVLLHYNLKYISNYDGIKNYGFSVRCIKDL